jgi:3',5'-cyclic-nucleotide phosphodiesterase
MSKKIGVLVFTFFYFGLAVVAQKKAAPVFSVIPLGVYGGMDESNLSSYMVGLKGSNQYVCLDAGTLHAGIAKAVKKKTFPASADILKNYIQGYLISHPHLDHVAGLIINSPDDTSKNIYGLPFCLDVIQDKYFSWKSWANFADKGEAPQLKKYHYVYLNPDTVITLENMNMVLRSFELSHSNPYKSTAFLLSSGAAYLLYLGDTGADELEKSDRLQQLWKTIAPTIAADQLKAIFIETSFPNEQPANKLFGHLTPALLMQEMQKLASLAGVEHLQKVAVVITHIKPTGRNESIIKKQLKNNNDLKLKLVFPTQGKLLEL